MYEVEGRGRVEKSQKYFYLNSPNNSVMLPVSMPPFSSLSNSLDPVVTWMICDLLRCISVAVVNPVGTSFIASSWILSAFCSEMPFISHNFFLQHNNY